MSASFSLRHPLLLTELRARFGGTLDAGIAERSIDRIVAPGCALGPGDLLLVVSPRFVRGASAFDGVILCPPQLAGRIAVGGRWIHPHADWVLAELLDEVPADVADSEIDADATVSAGAVVLRGARIGAGSEIGPNAVIYGNVRIGRRVLVGAGAVIGRPGFGWVRSPDGRPRRMPQIGGVVIDDDVEIGALCTLDAGTLSPTTIGAETKLDAQIHVGHNVQIGRRCLIAAQSGFAGSVVIEDDVQVGGQVGVKDHVRVGAGARLAAKSGVIADVPPGVTVAGFPAVPKGRWLRAMARLLER